MNPAAAVATAVTFVWLGMVLAVSFLETPLKFRAPEVTVRIGLGIGRLVFRALNTVEAVLAVALVVASVVGGAAGRSVVSSVVVVAVLVVQLGLIRPRLTHRSNRVLTGAKSPGSRSHYAYVALEVVKVIALIATGTLLLAS